MAHTPEHDQQHPEGDDRAELVPDDPRVPDVDEARPDAGEELGGAAPAVGPGEHVSSGEGGATD